MPQTELLSRQTRERSAYRIMVKPFVQSIPIRAFALIPQTGENKNLIPLCCDLSRVASVPPSELPNWQHLIDSSAFRASGMGRTEDLNYGRLNTSSRAKRTRDKIFDEHARKRVRIDSEV